MAEATIEGLAFLNLFRGESEAVPPPRSSMGKTQRAFK
jgi:hypothetical protein